MPYRAGTNVSNRESRAHYATVIPRVLANQSVLQLTLHDAGHGNPDATNNTLLRGLGITVVLDMNPHVRTFEVELRHTINGGTITRDVASLFEAKGGGRYEWSTEIGSPTGLGFPYFTDTIFNDGVVQLVLRLTVRNIHKTASQDYIVQISDAADALRAPAIANDDDFGMHRQFQSAGLSFWDDIVRFSPVNPVSAADVWVFDSVVDAILTIAPTVCGLLNWQSDYHSALFFTYYPSAAELDAGLNPWIGDVRHGMPEPTGGCP